MEKVRKFSIPYNGTDPKKFIEELDKRKKYVENVFLGFPNLIDNHCNYKYSTKFKYLNETVDEYEQNCKDFLLLTQNKIYKRLLTLNSGYYALNDSEMRDFVLNKLKPIIEIYKVDGFIITDYNMGCFIHYMFPKLELHTSCNCFQWTVRVMKLWQENVGISVFNPPREILRTPEKLKEMHDAGFKLKCLINEACLYGCPQSVNHAMYLSSKLISDKEIIIRCDRNDPSNIFKGNYILPRWLKEFDEYVDIYKISGRTNSTNLIFKIFDNYINERDDINLNDILIGGLRTVLTKNKIKIPTSIVPDRLLTCECKECDKTCFVCRNLINRYIKDNNL